MFSFLQYRNLTVVSTNLTGLFLGGGVAWAGGFGNDNQGGAPPMLLVLREPISPATRCSSNSTVRAD